MHLPDHKGEEEFDSDDPYEGDCPEDILTMSYCQDKEPHEKYHLDKATLKAPLEENMKAAYHDIMMSLHYRKSRLIR